MKGKAIHSAETETQMDGALPIEPDSLPEDELLYDLTDLFKVFSDTIRFKNLYALMTREMTEHGGQRR